MKKNILIVLATVLVVLVLAIVSCGPASPATQTTSQVTSQTSTQTTTQVATPQNGGTLAVVRSTDFQCFDQATVSLTAKDPSRLVNEALADPDWARGPAGTNEVNWALTSRGLSDYETGTVAESWQFPQLGTMIFKIRQGIHYALDDKSEASKLVGGRELTADDVVFSLEYYRNSPKGFLGAREPVLAAGSKVTKTGPWEITLTYPTDMSSVAWKFFASAGQSAQIVAPEVINKYGSQADWFNVVGTGPFILTDYVKAGSATLVKNPKYWMKDPVGPGKGNQLPYVDGIKYLIIPDVSTQLASMRTYKTDWITDVYWEDAESLKQSSPQLKSISFINQATHIISMRLDKTDLPFSDKRVRQALMLATDTASLKSQLYRNQAEQLVWPQVPAIGGGAPYVHLEEMPQAVKDLFQYNPDRAKQLLADAGYSSGLQFKIVVQSVPEQVDTLSAVKDMWAKVGVDLALDPRETSVYRGMYGTRNYDQMIMGVGPGFDAWLDLAMVRGVGNNYSYINDPEVERVNKEIGPIVLTDEAGVVKKLEQLWPYVVEQAFVIQLPEPYKYTMWWPWIMNYHGERSVVPGDCGWAKYVWLDQKLKQTMTGQ